MTEERLARRKRLATIEPMWDAMDCEDATDDPFYADFTRAA